MFRIFVLLTSMIPVLAPSSGINSLQPVATYKTIVTDQRLTGEWADGENVVNIELVPDSKILKEDDNKERKVPLGDNEKEVAFYSKAYAITIRQQGLEYVMVGSLSRINDQLFMDIMSLGIKDPKDPKNLYRTGRGFEFSPNYLAVFNIAKIEFAGNNKLSIQYLNGDFIKEQISKGNMRLKYEKDDLFDSFLLTASSFELRQFLEKYGHDERLYRNESTILTRKG